MSLFEKLSRQFAMGKLSSQFTKDKSKNIVDFTIFAYLGRLVMIIDQYRKQNIVEGPALEQFLAFASLVKEKTGEKAEDNIYRELSLLVEERLDSIIDLVPPVEKKQISSMVASLVPLEANTHKTEYIVFVPG